MLIGDNPAFEQIVNNSGLLRCIKKDLMYHELKEYWQTVEVYLGNNE